MGKIPDRYPLCTGSGPRDHVGRHIDWFAGSASMTRMPINSLTPDPRFQHVLVAADELVRLEMDEQGSKVERKVTSCALQRSRDALADLVKGSVASGVTE